MKMIYGKNIKVEQVNKIQYTNILKMHILTSQRDIHIDMRQQTVNTYLISIKVSDFGFEMSTIILNFT